MPVFFAKEQHVLIQLESDDDWQSVYNSCEGYINHEAFRLIHKYLNGVAETVVLEKGYVDIDYRGKGGHPSGQAK